MSEPEAGPVDVLSVVVGPHGFLDALKGDRRPVNGVQLEFDGSYSPTHRAFGAMAEHQRFDLSELALVTYVQARAAGKPLTLLPVTLVARFQQEQLVHDRSRGSIDPADLDGARVGVRAYSQTSGLWVRAVLRRQFEVDLSRIHWHTFEGSHVRGFESPSNVTLFDGEDMGAMFAAGELDAVIGRGFEGEEIRPVIPSVPDSARAWYEQTGTIMINHVLTVREDVLGRHPAALEAIYQRFRCAVEDRKPEDPPTDPAWSWLTSVDHLPVGYASVFPALRLAADEAYEQGLIPEPLADEDLAHPLVRTWI